MINLDNDTLLPIKAIKIILKSIHQIKRPQQHIIQHNYSLLRINSSAEIARFQLDVEGQIPIVVHDVKMLLCSVEFSLEYHNRVQPTMHIVIKTTICTIQTKMENNQDIVFRIATTF